MPTTGGRERTKETPALQGGDAIAPCRLAPHTCPPGRPRQQLGRSGSSGGGISRPVITPGTLLVWRRGQPAKYGHGPNNRGSRSATGGACRHPCWRRTGQPARSRPLPAHRTQKRQRLLRPRTPHRPRPAGAGGRTPRPRRRRPAPPALATRTCSATSSPSYAACQRWKGKSRTSSAGWRPQDGRWTRHTTATEKPAPAPWRCMPGRTCLSADVQVLEPGPGRRPRTADFRSRLARGHLGAVVRTFASE